MPPGREEPEQQVLGADVGVPEGDGGADGMLEHLPGPRRPALEVAGDRRVPLVGGLARHAERLADLGPRVPGGAARVDEVADQRVAGVGQLARDRGRGGEPSQGGVARGVGGHGGDQVVEVGGRSHLSTCS